MKDSTSNEQVTEDLAGSESPPGLACRIPHRNAWKVSDLDVVGLLNQLEEFLHILIVGELWGDALDNGQHIGQ